MDAGKRSINDIFNGNRVLEIPFFQRAYVWGEDQWGRLLEDMITITQTNKPYFLGSVILKQQETQTKANYGDRRTVIDGQQRLTTINIFFKVLCLKTNMNSLFERTFRLGFDNQIALLHNHNDAKAFSKIMELDSLEHLDGEDRITRAYCYFKDNLDPSKLDYQVISSKIQFVGIDLAYDEDEQQIFDTINSLGVKLTTAELLKNYFFGRDNIIEYEINWKSVFESDDETRQYWDQEVNAGRFTRTFIDLFFYAFLQIKIQVGSTTVKTEDKILFSRVERLFESYKDFIRDYQINKQSLLQEIREYALLFRKSFGWDKIQDPLPAENGIERINALIFQLETTTLMPYVLFASYQVKDQKVLNELFGFLEVYLMRRMVVHATTKNYNNLFPERLILNKILSKQTLVEYLNEKDDKVDYIPSDEELKNGFSESCLTNKQAAGVLYFIESKIRDQSRYATQLLNISKYSLEHLMPKKWENNWEHITDDQKKLIRNRKLLTLGNLAIITQPLNASIRDADWETKKNGRGNREGLQKYAEGLETLHQYLNFPEWNENAIDERASFLHMKATEIWKV
jgi:uncharacterized protein with ParB-like and HNH nuclease domain